MKKTIILFLWIITMSLGCGQPLSVDPLNLSVTNFLDPCRSRAQMQFNKNYLYYRDSVSIKTIDIGDLAHLSKIGDISCISDFSYDLFYINDNYMYLTDYLNNIIKITDISQPASPKNLGTIKSGADGLYARGNYLYIISDQKLKIADVTAPSKPSIISEFSQNKEYRNIYINGNYAYLRDSYKDYLDIIDISNPYKPYLVKSVKINRFSFCVYVKDNYLYIGSGLEGITIIDIEDIKNGNISEIASINVDGIVSQIYTKQNYLYAVIYPKDSSGLFNGRFNGGFNGLKVWDINNIYNPVEVKSVEYMRGLFDGDHLFSVDNGVLKITDISNPFFIREMKSMDLSFNYYDMDFKDNLAYIASGYGGLQVIKNSSSLLAGIFYTGNEINNVQLKDNYAYITEINTGLIVVDVKDPESIAVTGGIDIDGRTEKLYINGNNAYLAQGEKGIKVIDISKPDNPSLISSVDIYSHDFCYKDNYVYSVGKDFNIINMKDTTKPVIVTSFYPESYARSVAVQGNYAYVGTSAGLKILNITNLASPVIEGSLNEEKIDKIYVQGNYAYLMINSNFKGLKVADISDPTQPYIVSTQKSIYPLNIKVSGNKIYLTDKFDGIKMFDIPNSK